MIPAVDFFAGLGGFTEGARQSGVSVRLAVNHWDEAVRWHSTNHPDVEHVQQDIQQLPMGSLGDLADGVLIASPACQGFSQTGQPAAKGIVGRTRLRGDQRADLKRRRAAHRNTSWAVVSAAECVQPRTIVVENVPDMLRWALYPTWRGALESCGYHVTEHVIRASDYGSAQDRVRAIIVADLRAPIHLAKQMGEAAQVGSMLMEDSAQENRWSEIDSKSARMRTRMRAAQKQAGSRCLWNNVSEASGRPMEACAPTLTTQSGTQLYLLDGDRGRILNPRELASIQGLPDHYQLPKGRQLASKLIGNAIDVNVSRGVLNQIIAA